MPKVEIVQRAAKYIRALNAAAEGIVITHAAIICRTGVQRTALILCAAPAPMMDDEAIWLVLTGKPATAEA
jgi:hypothetical protein